MCAGQSSAVASRRSASTALTVLLRESLATTRLSAPLACRRRGPADMGLNYRGCPGLARLSRISRASDRFHPASLRIAEPRSAGDARARPAPVRAPRSPCDPSVRLPARPALAGIGSTPQTRAMTRQFLSRFPQPCERRTWSCSGSRGSAGNAVVSSSWPPAARVCPCRNRTMKWTSWIREAWGLPGSWMPAWTVWSKAWPT